MTESKGVAASAAPVLDDVRAFVRRFIVLGDAELVAVSLWTIHTHAFDAATSTPYLHLTSAEPECGKTQLLEVLEAIVARPWLTGRTSAAVLPRKIENETPTLLLDEADNVMGGSSEYVATLLEVLNTGYRRSGTATINVPDGDGGWTPKGFATFCPKALAGIGALPETLASRSIAIRLERRLPSESVEPWFPSEPPAAAEALRERCAAWAAEHLDELRELRRTVPRPEGLGDRAFDCWRPLLAIAELHGGDARPAAVELSGLQRQRQRSEAAHALAALAALFAKDDNVSSAMVAHALNADDELHFADKRRGDGIIARDATKLLKTFGLRARDVKVLGRSVMGFRLVDCAETISRYLPHGSPTTPTSPTSKPQSQAKVGEVGEVGGVRGGSSSVVGEWQGNRWVGPDSGAPTDLPPKGDLERQRNGPVDDAIRAELAREFREPE